MVTCFAGFLYCNVKALQVGAISHRSHCISFSGARSVAAETTQQPRWQRGAAAGGAAIVCHHLHCSGAQVLGLQSAAAPASREGSSSCDSGSSSSSVLAHVARRCCGPAARLQQHKHAAAQQSQLQNLPCACIAICASGHHHLLPEAQSTQPYHNSLLCHATNADAPVQRPPQYVPVDTIICFRASIPLVVSVIEFLFLGRELPTLRSWISLTGER